MVLRQMRYVDAHCHLDHYPDPRAVARACEESQTYTIAVTNVPSAFAGIEHIASGQAFVRPAAGLHPELVRRFPNSVDHLLTIIKRAKYVGEVGLDYSKATIEERQLQRRVLERVLDQCEQLGGRVITLHSRRADNDVVDLVSSATRSTMILHWFSGSIKTVTRAVAARCFFSVNPAMISSVNGRNIIAAIPDDRLLTETDGPFVKHAGRAVHPFEVAEFLPTIARLRGQEPQELSAVILNNFRRAVTIIPHTLY
jgi:TatD DNase family protein